jgi:hypothetical protein
MKNKTTNIMKQKTIFTLLFFCAVLSTHFSNAQTANGFVGVGTTDPKAKLQVVSDTSGVLIPQYATLALLNSQCLPKLNATDHKGLQVFVDEAINRGLWYYNGTRFVKVGPKLELDVKQFINQTFSQTNSPQVVNNLYNTVTPPTYGGFSSSLSEYTVLLSGLYMISLRIATSTGATTVTPLIEVLSPPAGTTKDIFYGTHSPASSAFNPDGTCEVTVITYLNVGERVYPKAINLSTSVSAISILNSTRFTIVKMD